MLGLFDKGPLHYNTELFLAKNYIFQENFVDAETKFIALEEDEEFPEKLLGQRETLRSYYFIKNQENANAIEHLEKAIELVKGRKKSTRLKFILGQLYMAEDQKNKANLMFRDVAKKAVDYDLEFNAKMNLARTAEGAGQQEVIAVLKKMLKDKKNKDYKDQIYFALANIYAEMGDLEGAIEAYKASAAASINNPKQKALSYLALADHYFSIPEYVDAQSFYDSSLISLSEDYPNYDQIKAKADNLTDLVTQLNTIQLEDSLQAVAAMSEEEREVLIQTLIEKEKEKDEAAEIAQQAKLEQMKAAAFTQTNKGGWLFDNATLLASANAEFIALFGNRPLEDNWRRSDKTSVSIDDFEEEESEELVEQDGVKKEYTADHYLKNIPSSQADIDSSNSRIEAALYAAADIFKNKLNDIQKSNEYYEELNRRFPKNEHRAKTLYQLFRNYDNAGQAKAAARNKSKLMAEFPKSEYAMLIKYPNRTAEDEKRKAKLNRRYKGLYNQFLDSNYTKVITGIDRMKFEESDGEMAGKYQLLRAFAVGRQEGKLAFEKSLQAVVSGYSSFEAGKDAQDILARISTYRVNASAEQEKAQIAALQFDTLIEGKQRYAVLFSKEIVDVNLLYKQTQAFSLLQPQGKSLQIDTLGWSDGGMALTIDGFNDQAAVVNFEKSYYESVLKSTKNLGNMRFGITDSNWAILQKNLDTERYLKFYKEHYVKP